LAWAFDFGLCALDLKWFIHVNTAALSMLVGQWSRWFQGSMQIGAAFKGQQWRATKEKKVKQLVSQPPVQLPDIR